MTTQTQRDLQKAAHSPARRGPGQRPAFPGTGTRARSSPARPCIGLAIFLVAPFVLAVVLSFYRVQLNSPRPARFIGFEQYTRLFTDPDLSAAFGQALLNNFTFALIVVPVQTVLALAPGGTGQPQAARDGDLPDVHLHALGLPAGPDGRDLAAHLLPRRRRAPERHPGTFQRGTLTSHDWLGSPSTALGSIIVMSIWQSVSFQMIIVLAALQSVPTELYEAASLDRANKWQQFMNVTVPGIRNTLIFVALSPPSFRSGCLTRCIS